MVVPCATMKSPAGLGALLSLVISASASLIPFESRASPPSGFFSQGDVPPDQSITLRVALTANNLAGLQSKAMSISTPGSSDFRQFLSAGRSSPKMNYFYAHI